MPTKSKLPRNKVPQRPPPRLPKPPEPETKSSLSTIQADPEARTSSGLSQEAEDQFELELLWCIQQFQNSLDVRTSEKAAANLIKTLNTLKSNNVSLIKKRQVMRNALGDYRSKMAEDEKKYSKTPSSMRFTNSNNKKIEKKSTFVRKAPSAGKIRKVSASTDESNDKKEEKIETKAIINPDVSNTPFKFNFSINTEES